MSHRKTYKVNYFESKPESASLVRVHVGCECGYDKSSGYGFLTIIDEHENGLNIWLDESHYKTLKAVIDAPREAPLSTADKIALEFGREMQRIIRKGVK